MSSFESRAVSALTVVVAAVLAAAATQGTLLALACCGVAMFVLALTVLGSTRMGIVLLGGAFLTAPMYRGIGSAGPITPTDGLLFLGLVLLLPVVMERRLHLPGAFLIATIALSVIGLVSSAHNSAPVPALVYLVQWLVVFAGLPAFLVMWGPSRRVVDGLLGCYVLGIGEEGTIVDLLAYEGYKFVGVIVTLVSGLLGASGWSYFAVFLYTFFADFFFLVRLLLSVLVPLR